MNHKDLNKINLVLHSEFFSHLDDLHVATTLMFSPFLVESTSFLGRPGNEKVLE